MSNFQIFGAACSENAEKWRFQTPYCKIFAIFDVSELRSPNAWVGIFILLHLAKKSLKMVDLVPCNPKKTAKFWENGHSSSLSP